MSKRFKNEKIVKTNNIKRKNEKRVIDEILNLEKALFRLFNERYLYWDSLLEWMKNNGLNAHEIFKVKEFRSIKEINKYLLDNIDDEEMLAKHLNTIGILSLKRNVDWDTNTYFIHDDTIYRENWIGSYLRKNYEFIEAKMIISKYIANKINSLRS